MGKSKSSSTKGAKAAPRCSCDHPFNCSCGNRPERPSRGHKWDPEAQAWGGKGHKQKGAGTAQAAKEAVVTRSGGTRIEQWQRLPTMLLQEYCKSQKRPPPKFKDMGKPGRHRYRVVVPDQKKQDRDLIYHSNDPRQNDEQAKEEGAMLALLDLCRSMPYERKLPEPYKTTWLNITSTKPPPAPGASAIPPKVAQKAAGASSAPSAQAPQETAGSHAASSSSTLTLANRHRSSLERRKEEQSKRQVRNMRIRRHENRRLANKDYPVFLSAGLRKRVESILRGDSAPDFEVDEEPFDEDDPDEVKMYVADRLREVGFTIGQAKAAWAEVEKRRDEEERMFDRALQFLLLHVPEDDLPEGFNPKGRTLDVVITPKAETAMHIYSLPDADDKAGSLGSDPIRIFSLFAEHLGLPWPPLASAPTDPGDSARAEEEFEALQAIAFDKSTSRSSHSATHTLTSIELNSEGKYIDIFTDAGYPSTPPVLLLRGCSSTPLQLEFIRRIFDQELTNGGEPVMFEAYTVANDLLSEGYIGAAVDTLSQRRSSAAAAANMSSGTSTQHPKTFKATRKRNRATPRDSRRSFWNMPPASYPPATPFPSTVPGSLKRARDNLPASKARPEFFRILHNPQNKQVILVTGETGCGKTTQIPQFILEENPTSKIVVAQPRRLAATGVAGRVANERGEPEPGRDSVGYVVRGDRALGNNARLVFCTTGVLLRQLQDPSALDNITHLVIDEVHERHLDSDVLLGILKERLQTDKKLRVVLMSATMDADRFAAYWGSGTPRMHIPGFTHPVQDFFLKDVLELTNYVPPRQGKNKGGSHSSSKFIDDDYDEDDDDDDTAETEDSTVSGHGIPMSELISRVDEKKTDNFMVAALVKSLVETKRHVGEDGSVLVFLPGVEEIKRCERDLVTFCGRDFVNNRMKVFQLHGGLRAQEQRQVFAAYGGYTKVILSTNVAETSITIPDCVVVIDGCREKQSSFDPVNRMPLLLEKFASQDSLRQRRGRAGRVRPGVCYKMITKKTFAGLRVHGEPEIKRCALDSTILNLKYLGVGSEAFLRGLLDPPDAKAVASAMDSLRILGALDGLGELSALGCHLAQIPAPPTVGKLLVMGCLLGCRDAALVIAAGMSVGRSPFMKVMVDRRKGKRAEEFRENDTDEKKRWKMLEEREKLRKSVGHSDHSLLAAAYEKWRAAEGGGEKRRVCDTYGLSGEGMREFKQLRDQYDGALRSAGWEGGSYANMNCGEWKVVRAAVVAALAPGGLVKVERGSIKYDETKGGNVERAGNAKELKFWVRGGEKWEDSGNEKLTRVFIHPSSGMFEIGNYSCPWLVFHSMVTTSRAWLRDISECSGFGLLLFGGELEVKASEGVLIVGGFARLAAPPRIAVLVNGLKDKMDEILERRIGGGDGGADGGEDETIIKTVTKLLIGDGLL